MRTGVLILATVASYGQQFPKSTEPMIKEYWAPGTSDEKKSEIVLNLIETDALRSYVLEFQTPPAVRPLDTALRLERFRTDQQVGNASVTSAATSVVAKTGMTEFLSAAFESGAVSRKAGAEAITFQFKALPLQQMLSGQKPKGCELAEDTCTTGAGKFWNGLAGGVTFNQSTREIALPPTLASTLGFLKDTGALSALSVRYEFATRRPKAEMGKALEVAVKALQEQRGPALLAFLTKDTAFQMILEDKMGKTGWRLRTIEQLKKETTEAGFRQVLARAYAELGTEVSREDVDALRGLRSTVTEKLNAARADVLYKKAFTVEYLHQRPVDQPRLSQFRGIVSTSLGRNPNNCPKVKGQTKKKDEKCVAPPVTEAAAMPNASLSFNFGATLYHHVAAATQPGRLRDAQFSSALDFPLGKWGSLGYPKATLAGYYQYMKENAILEFGQDAVTPGNAAIPLPRPAIELLNTKGHIGVAQLRLSVPLGDSGASIPVAASWANRSELIKDPSWQAHIGLTYDLSALGKLLSGGK